MKKTLLAVAIAGMSVTGVASAGTVAGGISSANQDFKIGNLSASYSGTGIYLDWRSDTAFGSENVAWGVLWNTATNIGNVLEGYIQPKVTINQKSKAFARLGISKSGATSSASTSGASFAWGVGVTYDFTKEIGAEVVYDKLYSDSNWDMNSFSIGVTYHY